MLPAGTWFSHAVGVYVRTLAGDRICAMTRFENSVLPTIGLPRSLPAPVTTVIRCAPSLVR
jgi:hypothetical protein